MPVDIRYAGLEPDVERRACFAVNGLAAHEIQARASAWDGTRCDLLITDADDVYGRIAIDLARRRNTPILALTGDIQRRDTWALWLRRDVTVAALTKSLLAALSAQPGSADSAAPAETAVAMPAEHDRKGLVLLALEAGLARNKTLFALRDRKLLSDPQAGRLHASNHSDILHAKSLLTGGGWTFTPWNRAVPANGWDISASLDATLLEAALHRDAKLPDFPLREVWLCDWPDLGKVPERIDALRVAQALLRGKTDADAISQSTGIAPASVNACLWAFAASGLLQHATLSDSIQPLAQVTVKSRFSTLVSRMARHFGLQGAGK